MAVFHAEQAKREPDQLAAIKGADPYIARRTAGDSHGQRQKIALVQSPDFLLDRLHFAEVLEGIEVADRDCGFSACLGHV